ncbi:lytic transglycosylase domain-containing protein [Puteibacter caeruleilacunae]|nr:lytic transglycosylase domain-containing protein [Puteibacter caeruleilacunae]
MRKLITIASTMLIVGLAWFFTELFNFSTVPVRDGDIYAESEGEPPIPMYKSHKLPDSIDFAGEQVPLQYFDVAESLDRELQVNTYWHSQTIHILKKMPRYFSQIEPILKEEGVPEDFKYLAIAESALNERAVSPSSAVGLWQFMKATAREYGLEVTAEVDERYHIEKSTRAACKYLKSAYKKYGSWTMVAAAYNAGRTGMSRQIVRQKEKDYYNLLLNPETSRYVFRIVAMKLVLNNPKKYGFYIEDEDKYPIIPTYTIEVKSAVKNFADFAKSHDENYKILKYFNPWLRQSYLNNTAKKTYQIVLPKRGFREGVSK